MTVEASDLWMQAHAENNGDRADMWDWLEAKYLAMRERLTELEAALRVAQDLLAQEGYNTDPDYTQEWATVSGPLVGDARVYRSALDNLAARARKSDEIIGDHADDCAVHQAMPPWRCTCARDRLARRVTELEAALREAVPVVDELCAWVDTNLSGCVEVQERGEQMLRRLRALAGDAGGADG